MIALPPLELTLRVSLTREGGLAYLPGLARTRSIDLTDCPPDLRQEVGDALRRTAPLATPDCAAQGGDPRYFHVEVVFRDPASGPTLVGALHDRLGGWSVALGLCAGLCVAMAGCGLLAGRNIQVGQFHPRAAEPPRR